MTTRERVADLAPFRDGGAPELRLGHLGTAAGVGLLRGADLGAVACFFESPWRRVSPSLGEADQAWLLSQAAVRLRALGRLGEALEPMRAGLDMAIEQEDWKSAAAIASNLSELELTLGDVESAVRDAEQSVDFAERSGDAFERMAFRATLADALHQAGRADDALARFGEAETMQAEDQPVYPLLYSLRGFQYCDLLLAGAERAAWQADGRSRRKQAPSLEACHEVERRAAQALPIAEQNHWILDIALNHLTLARAELYRSILEPRRGNHLPAPQAAPEIAQAVNDLRRAGQSDELPKGLLTRAWWHCRTGNPDAAAADLDEAWEIAQRGPMPLFMADVQLHRARLFGDRPALADARRLIEQHGYDRRLRELEDAEAMMAS